MRHTAEAHEHFRVGSDCGECRCGRYRDVVGLADQVRAVLLRHER